MKGDSELVVVDWNNNVMPSGQDYPMTRGKADALKNKLNNPKHRNIHDANHRVITKGELRAIEQG